MIDDAEPEPAGEIEGMMRGVISQFEALVKANKKIPPELLVSLASIEDPWSIGRYCCRAHDH